MLSNMHTTTSADPDEWTCAACGNMNWLRPICNRCRGPRATQPQPQVQQAALAAATARTAPSRFANPQVMPSQQMVYAPPSVPVSSDRDWTCTKCNNLNWKWREACNRCQEPRATAATTMNSAPPSAALNSVPATVPSMAMMAAQQYYMPAPAMQQRPSYGMAFPMQQTPMPGYGVSGMGVGGGVMHAPAQAFNGVNASGNGDWTCVECSNINWSWREACNRCKADRPSAASATDVRQPCRLFLSSSCMRGAACPLSHATTTPSQQYGVGQKRGAGMFSDGDWTCSDCSNVNWSWRESCNRCQMSRNEVDAKRSKKTEVESQPPTQSQAEAPTEGQ